MHRKRERQYLFNAQAVGFSGEITRPHQQVIDVQAASALTIAGGYGSARAENFRFKEILSFDAAYTQVLGTFSEEEQAASTLTTATVEGLNILDMVTADSVTGRISSRHPVGQDEPSILLLGSHFRGLRIAGKPVEVDIDDHTFSKYDTYKDLGNRCQQEPALMDELLKRTCQIRSKDRRRFPPEMKDFCTVLPDKLFGRSMPPIIGTSLVRSIAPTPFVPHYGNTIHIPHFGTVHLAELFISRGQRQLSMLRVELGCPVDSLSLMSGYMAGNGSYYP